LEWRWGWEKSSVMAGSWEWDEAGRGEVSAPGVEGEEESEWCEERVSEGGRSARPVWVEVVRLRDAPDAWEADPGEEKSAS